LRRPSGAALTRFEAALARTASLGRQPHPFAAQPGSGERDCRSLSFPWCQAHLCFGLHGLTPAVVRCAAKGCTRFRGRIQRRTTSSPSCRGRGGRGLHEPAPAALLELSCARASSARRRPPWPPCSGGGRHHGRGRFRRAHRQPAARALLPVLLALRDGCSSSIATHSGGRGRRLGTPAAVASAFSLALPMW